MLRWPNGNRYRHTGHSIQRWRESALFGRERGQFHLWRRGQPDLALDEGHGLPVVALRCAARQNRRGQIEEAI